MERVPQRLDAVEHHVIVQIPQQEAPSLGDEGAYDGVVLGDVVGVVPAGVLGGVGGEGAEVGEEGEGAPARDGNPMKEVHWGELAVASSCREGAREED